MTLEREISIKLQDLGIPAHLLGYRYGREAIKMTVDNFSMVNAITKGLYPAVAQKFNTSPSKVERAIRHAIESANTRNATMRRTFNNIKPSNGEFIATIADNIRLEKDF